MLSLDEVAHLMYTVRMEVRLANGGTEEYTWEAAGRSVHRVYEKLTHCDSARELAKAEGKTSWFHLPAQHKVEYITMSSIIQFFRTS